MQYFNIFNPENKINFFSSQEFQYVSKIRIIQKNLVHFLGFPDSIYDENLLSSFEYFGQFGRINKIMMTSKIDEITKKKTNSAYITFSNNEEAAYAILSVDSIIIDGNFVRAFFGTTKYCIHFLNNEECYNKDKCMFLHYYANENDIIDNNTKFGYNEHIKLAKKIINYDSFENKSFILGLNIKFKTILPNVKSIYLKDENYFFDEIKSKSLSNSSSTSGNSNTKSLSNKNIYDLRRNVYLNKLFKYKDKSRFFNNNDETKIKNNGIEVPLFLMDIVDEISIRIPFFIQFENLISFKKLEVEYCKKKLNINDLSYYINNNVF
jgi:hypothetical protein